MEEVPHRTSLAPFAFPCSVLCLIGVEAEGFVDYQGRAEIIAIVRWNLRPVIFRVGLTQINLCGVILGALADFFLVRAPLAGTLRNGSAIEFFW